MRMQLLIGTLNEWFKIGGKFLRGDSKNTQNDFYGLHETLCAHCSVSNAKWRRNYRAYLADLKSLNSEQRSGYSIHSLTQRQSSRACLHDRGISGEGSYTESWCSQRCTLYNLCARTHLVLVLPNANGSAAGVTSSIWGGSLGVGKSGGGMRQCVNCGLDWHFPAGPFFDCLFMSAFEKYPIRSFAHLNMHCLVFFCWTIGLLYIFWIKMYPKCAASQIFSPIS